MSQEQAKETILTSATDAAMNGIGAELGTDELRAQIREYWQGRLQLHQQDILDKWDDRGAAALEKATKFGERAAKLASDEGQDTVTLTHFQTAISQINQGDDYSNWC